MSFKCSIGFHDWYHDSSMNSRDFNYSQEYFLSSEDMEKYNAKDIRSVFINAGRSDKVCKKCGKIELEYTKAIAREIRNRITSNEQRLLNNNKLKTFRKLSSEIDKL